MKWVGLLLCLFTGCALRVTVEPLGQLQPKQSPHTSHHRAKSKPRSIPTPTPKPDISPLPPDPRIRDIIQTLKLKKA